MRLIPANRWSLAFADLTLLMLGFVVLSFVRPAPPTDRVDADVNLPAIEFAWPASVLFEPREAMLTAIGREKASEVAGAAGTGARQINVSMTGRSDASVRLDQWELSAARMAAFARGLKASGVDESAIVIGGQSQVIDDEPQHLIATIRTSSSVVAPANGTALASQITNDLEE